METTIEKITMLADTKNRIQDQFNRVFFGITRACEQREIGITMDYKDTVYGIQYLPSVGYEFVCFDDDKLLRIKEMPMDRILVISQNLEQIYRSFVNALVKHVSDD